MQQLSAMDASFVYLETPHTPMHIGSVGIYDPSTAPGGFVRFKDILGFIESRLSGARWWAIPGWHSRSLVVSSMSPRLALTGRRRVMSARVKIPAFVCGRSPRSSARSHAQTR